MGSGTGASGVVGSSALSFVSSTAGAGADTAGSAEVDSVAGFTSSDISNCLMLRERRR